MAGNTNVRETLKEVIGETPETPKQPNNETNAQVSKSQEKGETKSGETPIFVAGIDVSDVPENDRPRIKELLEKKAGLLEKGYQGKFKEVASLKKALDSLERQGINVDEAQTAVQEYIDKKKNPSLTQEKKVAVKILDKIMDEAQPEQRESLKQLREIIGQETNVSELQKKIEQLENTLSNVATGYTGARKKEVETEINSLRTKYGDELVDKYYDTILNDCIKYPNATVKKALHIHADPDEIEQAIIKRDTRQKEKINAITGNGGGVTSQESISTKQGWKSLLKQINSTSK